MYRRLANAILTVAVLGLFYHGYHFSQNRNLIQATPIQAAIMPDGQSTPESIYLDRLAVELNLTKQVEWRSWKIRPAQEIDSWSPSTDVSLRFGAERKPKVVRAKGTGQQKTINVVRQMALPIHTSPVPGRSEASDFLFGVASTYERVAANRFATVRSWARWLTDGHSNSNGATLVILLERATDAQVSHVDSHIQSLGMNAYITTTDDWVSQGRLYHELSKVLGSFSVNLAANGQVKRWFGLIDDTVFFPSLSVLRERLFAYNAEREHYLALPSEREDWVAGKRVTYGGGAVMFTRPALLSVNRLPCFRAEEIGEERDQEAQKDWQRARDGTSTRRWDKRLQACIFQQTPMQMHVVPGFYSPLAASTAETQAEVGAYETGVQPLVLHDAETRHGLQTSRAHLVTDICGEACFMQRYVFHDDWVLVNGVSLSHYPRGIRRERRPPADSPVATAAGRVVVDSNGEDETELLGPRWGRREVWTLADSRKCESGAVYQAYVKRGEVDSVVVLLWDHPPAIKDLR